MRPLIIGLGINGWNVARALLRGGVAPVVVDDSPESIFWKSRRLHLAPAVMLHGDSLLQALEAASRSYGPLLLISALEETVAFLSANRHRIPGAVRLAFPAPETVELLLDKKLFYQSACRLGLPITPMHFFRPGAWDLPDGGLRFPCILKTRRKKYVEGMKKAYLLRSVAECQAVLAELQRLKGIRPEELLLQEWVPGGDGDVFFCMHYFGPDGTLRASFTGRKIRQWPPLVGGTSCAEPADEPQLEELSERFFRSVGMRGLCSMEFKRNEADGSFYMIEPTACRADYQEGVAVANGCNLPLLMYRIECGLPAESGRKGRRRAIWVHVGDDYQSALAQARGRLPFWRYLLSLPRPREYAIFCHQDWRPFAELIRRKIRNRLARWSGRISAFGRPSRPPGTPGRIS
ncbi:MAG: hypothetical protein N2036_02525 [Bryobacteraceae bacterium]|nr:hypothetical protein [Bryobacteraceae bacterium]MCX7602928.1 hypothetical protein [Bryobacteraceae bacterium]